MTFPSYFMLITYQTNKKQAHKFVDSAHRPSGSTAGGHVPAKGTVGTGVKTLILGLSRILAPGDGVTVARHPAGALSGMRICLDSRVCTLLACRTHFSQGITGSVCWFVFLFYG